MVQQYGSANHILYDSLNHIGYSKKLQSAAFALWSALWLTSRSRIICRGCAENQLSSFVCIPPPTQIEYCVFGRFEKVYWVDNGGGTQNGVCGEFEEHLRACWAITASLRSNKQNDCRWILNEGLSPPQLDRVKSASSKQSTAPTRSVTEGNK